MGVRSVLGLVAAFSWAAVGCSGDQVSEDGRAAPMGTPRAGAGGGGGSGAAAGTGGFGTQPTHPMMQVGGGTGGAGGDGMEMGEECAAITRMADVMLGPVDIVWIIDGSGSMLDETAAVQQNITNFANMIAMAGIDHHVVMLATGDVAAPTPLGMDPAHYLYVPAAVDSHNALQLLLDLQPQYATFLRAEAALHFIVVSDDESFVTATDFQTRMEMLVGKKFTFHAVASESVNGGPCIGACGLPLICGGFAPGVQYYALADATGGQKISICTADWSMVFGPLQEAVIASAPLPCDYPIPEPPDGETLDPEKVNLEFTAPGAMQAQVFPHAAGEDQCGENLAWFYDDPDAPTQIQMCPAACTQIGAGGTVQIQLGCETVPLVVE
jgi:hypothetical protein